MARPIVSWIGFGAIFRPASPTSTVEQFSNTASSPRSSWTPPSLRTARRRISGVVRVASVSSIVGLVDVELYRGEDRWEGGRGRGRDVETRRRGARDRPSGRPCTVGRTPEGRSPDVAGIDDEEGSTVGDVRKILQRGVAQAQGIEPSLRVLRSTPGWTMPPKPAPASMLVPAMRRIPSTTSCRPPARPSPPKRRSRHRRPG